MINNDSPVNLLIHLAWHPYSVAVGLRTVNMCENNDHLFGQGPGGQCFVLDLMFLDFQNYYLYLYVQIHDTSSPLR